MSSPAVVVKPLQYQFRVERGPHLGTIFSFNQNVIKLGRDADNDAVFANDHKVSRHHAEIFLDRNQIHIRNLSEKAPLFVNGKQVQHQILSQSSLITIGDTDFRIKIDNPSAVTVNKANRTAPPIPIRPKFKIPKSVPGPSSTGQFRFYVIIVVIGVILAWLLSSDLKNSKKESRLRTEDQVVLDVENSENFIKTFEKKLEDSGQQSLQYKTAQEHYAKGFRDYRQGQYARAMLSFQAALSFYPQHDLAKKYLNLSKRKFDQLVQFNMIQGRRYKGKNHYRLCKSSYAAVMMMVKDSNDPIYKEAKQYYNECNILFEGKF